MGLRNAVRGVLKCVRRPGVKGASITLSAIGVATMRSDAVMPPPLVTAEHGVRTGERVDRVIVLKRRRRLLTVRGGKVVHSYPISLGFNPTGHKQREGDGRTPEGRYRLDWRHVSLTVGPAIHISYPSARDRKRARAAGRLPGGGIMVHSLDPSLPWQTARPQARNWTHGCIGLRPEHLEALWHAVEDGTPIDIRP